MTASDIKVEKPTEGIKQLISTCRVVNAREIITITKPSLICTLDGNLLEKMKKCEIEVESPESKET